MKRWFEIGAAMVFAAVSAWPRAAHAEPSVTECLAASDDSIKLDNEHKLRAERERLLVCASDNCPPDIRQECAKRVEQVNQALPSIVFDVRDAAGDDVSAVKVTMDGELIAERLVGTAIALDPGEHDFTFEVPGQPAVRKHLVIRVSEQNRRENVVFEQLNRAHGLAAPPANPVATAPTPGAPAPAPTREQKSIGTQRLFAIAAGGVGLVGVAVGSAFGIVAIGQRNTAHQDCPRATCATRLGSTEWSDAKRAADISTVAFIVGGVGLASAATLWFTGGSGSAPQVGFGLGGVQLKGNW